MNIWEKVEEGIKCVGVDRKEKKKKRWKKWVSERRNKRKEAGERPKEDP